MRYLNNNNEFRLENLLNEAKLYYSPSFNNILDNLLSTKGAVGDIANDLKEIQYDDIDNDITFIDSSKDGYVSFLQSKNVQNGIDSEFPNSNTNVDNLSPMEIDHIFSKNFSFLNKSKNNIKIGRLVSKVLGNKYNSNDIEAFTNAYKAQIDAPSDVFELVEGEDINKWYNSINYYNQDGSLGGSCMRSQTGIFELYTNNPETCKLLILRETNSNKIKGRAIVWKVYDQDISGFDYFMDRVYTNKDSDIIRFNNYARKNGWARKAYNTSFSSKTIEFRGQEDTCEMKVHILPSKITGNEFYENYPYLDTFKFYFYDEGYLTNDDDVSGDFYTLEDTSGGYVDSTKVYSDFLGEYLDDDDAVYSEEVSSYLNADDAIYVDDDWYPDDSDKITFCGRTGEYYKKEDCVYCEKDYEWYKLDDTISVITVIDEDDNIRVVEYDYYYKDDADDVVAISDIANSDKFTKEQIEEWNDYYGISTDIMSTDYNHDWVLDNTSLVVFEVIGKKGEYLSKADSFILGIETITKGVIMDKNEYNEKIDIKEIVDKGNKLKNKLEKEYNEADEDTKKELKRSIELIDNRLEDIE